MCVRESASLRSVCERKSRSECALRSAGESGCRLEEESIECAPSLCVRERAGVSVPFTLRVRVDADLKRKSRLIRRLNCGGGAKISQIRIKKTR